MPLKISKTFLFVVCLTIIMGICFILIVYWTASRSSKNIDGSYYIYTVQKIERNCISNSCKYDVQYSESNLVKSALVEHVDFDVGDKVYEKLVCRRIGGIDDGKEYDLTVRDKEHSCISGIGIPKYALVSTLKNLGKSCGGVCKLEFMGKYSKVK